MPITLGSNIASLGARRELDQSQRDLSKVFERLSSGQRINRASDDAAGLSVSSSLNLNRRVFNQGIRNINDGLSTLSIADGSLSQLSTILERIKELAAQAANGTLSSKQRESLDAEAQELAEEFFRISRSTKFNGLNLFDGTLSDGLRLQFGYGSTGGISGSLGGKLGTGDYASPVAYAESANTAGERTVELGDVNNDGNLDIVSLGDDLSASTLTIRLGNGDGSFSQSISYSTTVPTGTGLALGDINNDGILDIAITGNQARAGLSPIIRLGRGDGTFEDESSIGGTIDGKLYNGSLSDLNGDGILDFIAALDVTSNAGGAVYIQLGNGDGSFATAQTYLAHASSIYDVKVGDINGDGILDLVTGGDASSTYSIGTLLGNGDGTFGTVTTYSFGSNQVRSIALGDLNGDGTSDIVVGHPAFARIFIGDGNGSFSESGTFAGLPSVVDVKLADVNGDGNEDIVLSGNNGVSAGRVNIYLGDGTGSFGSAITRTTGSSSGLKVVLGDLDGDGVLDLASAGKTGTTGTVDVALGITREGINPILEFSLKTKSDALQAIAPITRKLESISSQRGVLGALQSRLNASFNVLRATTDNYAEASARITDVDTAFEVASLTRLSILREAGVAVLAQANQQPAIALQLLG